MSDLQEMILEKVKSLDTEQQKAVLEFIETLQPATFDYEDYWRKIDEIHAELRAKYGDGFSIDVQKMLDEIREEASWPRM